MVSCSSRLRGFALIEAILFMLIVGVAAGGMLSLFANNNRNSANAVVERQALDAANALLAEVRAAPFTAAESLVPGGPEGGQQRGGANAFDHISDYHNLTIGPGITDVQGNSVPGLEAFTARITVAPHTINGISGAALPADSVALVTVSVTHPTLSSAIVVQSVEARDVAL